MKKLFLCLVVNFSLSLYSSSSTQPNDTVSLTYFRIQADTHGNLISNWTGPDACASSWTGVKCSPTTARVTSLSLPSLSLRGPLDRLAGLDQLRFLDLSNNRLNGTVSPLYNCTNLKLLYLAGNDLSGEIRPEVSSLRRILRLDLSDNNIGGAIPGEISRLTRILTLRLQNNMLAGKIPDFSESLVNLKDLNLTNNELYGKLPDSMLSKFGDESFYGNEGLCGSRPLPECSFTGVPAAGGDQTVPSNPSSLPHTTVSSDETTSAPRGSRRSGLSTAAVVAIVIANCVVMLVIVSFAVAHYCASDRRRSGGTSSSGGSENGGKRRKSGSGYGSDKKVYGNAGNGGDSDGTTGTEKSRLVFYDGKKEFDLEELLRASAEMLGKGSLGTVYRAVLDDGTMMAVKRLKDANPCPKANFEQYMDVIGKLNHPNVVSLRAYYYAKEEKLLVYDYLANGSLHQLLHGDY